MFKNCENVAAIINKLVLLVAARVLLQNSRFLKERLRERFSRKHLHARNSF